MVNPFRSVVFYIFFAHRSADTPTEPNLPPLKLDPTLPPSSSTTTTSVVSTTSRAPTRRYRWRYLLTHLFLLTVSGAILALLALFVHAFEDQPISAMNWDSGRNQRSIMTLNSAIAWMGAAAKVGVMLVLAECMGQAKWRLFEKERRKLSDLELVDAAGRGPLGALGWILRFRGGLIVHLGAAAVLVSVGFDPAIQQLVRYEEATVIDPSQAASIFSNRAYAPSRGFDQGLVLAAPRSLLLGAYSAVLSDPSSSTSTSSSSSSYPVTYTCPSGNCTFPATTSVGLCSSCTEAPTSALERNCTTLSSTNKFCRGTTCFTSGQLCSYSLNNVTVGGGKTYLNILASDSSSNPTSNGKVSISADRVNLTALYIQPNTNASIDLPPGVSFSSAGSPVLPLAPGFVSSSAGSTHRARAYTCSLQYCEKTFSTRIISGVLHENFTTSPNGVKTFTMDVPSLSEIDDALYGTLLNLTDSKEESTRISVAALYALSTGFALAMEGNASVLDTATPTPGEISEFHRAVYQDLVSAAAAASPSSSSADENSDNGVFTTLMNNITLATTNAIRNSGAPTAGSTLVRHIFVRVSWPWLAWPVSILVLAFLLLVFETAKARRLDRPWLGTSQLAAVFIPVEQEVRRDFDLQDASGRDRAGMREVAERVKIRVASVRAVLGRAGRVLSRIDQQGVGF